MVTITTTKWRFSESSTIFVRVINNLHKNVCFHEGTRTTIFSLRYYLTVIKIFIFVQVNTTLTKIMYTLWRVNPHENSS
jgi:hypothetical protein